MIYTVQFLHPAVEDLKRLEKRDLLVVDEDALRLAENPRPSGSLKLHGRHATYRHRSGDFRILYTIDDAAKLVTIVRILNRNIAYR